MKKAAPNRQAVLLFATGLLIAAATQLLSRFIPVPDLITGGFIGLGIGLEILALVRLKKLRRLNKAN